MTPSQDLGFDPQSALIPNIVDHFAKVKPDAIYAEYPKSPTSYEHGFRQITFRDLANAVNGLAWWLTSTLGPGNGEILPYLGPNDVRYPALVLGAVKAGYVIFCTSPRNSPAAHENLFSRLNCTKLLAPVPQPPPVTAILAALKLDAYNVPSVDELLHTSHPHYEFSKTHSEVAKESVIVLHTSGSTGIPKPIIWNHDMANRHMMMNLWNPPQGFGNTEQLTMNKRLFSALPPFHAAGIAMLVFIGLPFGTTLICPTSVGLPTAAGLVEVLKQIPVDVAFVVPSMVQELSQSPELLEFCSQHLERILYAGGDLPQAIGDAVASKIPLVNRYGASEVGLLNLIYPTTSRDSQKDWRYLHFHPATGAEFRKVTADEYELVLVRASESEHPLFVFGLFPELQEYHTKDLFVRHPDAQKPDLWRYSTRADDVVVFLNGEKTNPLSMEQHISASNPQVTGILVAGAQRFQASLLVEVASTNLSASERAAAIERLWPSIEEANAVCPAHARVDKTHILFTKAEKPMLRTIKGTIQRTGTLALYVQELDILYADADQLLTQAGGERYAGPGRVNDAQVVADYVRRVLLSITGWDKEQMGDGDNFFHLGLDSLQAINATRWFKAGLAFPNFTPNTIYLHPSVSELTQAIIQDQQGQAAIVETQLAERSSILQEFLDRVHINPDDGGHINPNNNNNNNNNNNKGHTVILTGSTGTLGTYLLDTLLKTPSVAHVYCLNRSPDSITALRQRAKNSLYNLNIPLDSPRLTFYTTDLSRPDLGLPLDTLSNLQATATLIIHNAWTVNFNLSLPSFHPNLSGIVNLINFSSSSPNPNSPHLFFISSISSTMNHTTPSKTTPETIITTTSPAPSGYANSKYLAEHILHHAVESSTRTRTRPLRASIARVGQVAGAANTPGLWNKAEWFPSLVQSSLHIGAVPGSLGGAGIDRIDWVPVDLLAGVLVELALRHRDFSSSSSAPSSETRTGTGTGDIKDIIEVLHPHNLSPTPWTTTILPPLTATLSASAGKHIEIIPLRSWVQRIRADLERSTSSSSSSSSSSVRFPARDEDVLQRALEKNPAVKLLSFFEGLAELESGPGVEDGNGNGNGNGNENIFETSETARKSGLLRAVPGVKREWVEKWIGEWLG